MRCKVAEYFLFLTYSLISLTRIGWCGIIVKSSRDDTYNIAGWSSSVARRAHNPKVVSSNLAPATNEKARNFGTLSRLRVSFYFLKNAVEGTIRALSHQKYSIKNNNTVTGLVPVAVFFMPVSVRHHAFSESHLKRIPQPVLFLVQECARRC